MTSSMVSRGINCVLYVSEEGRLLSMEDTPNDEYPNEIQPITFGTHHLSRFYRTMKAPRKC